MTAALQSEINPRKVSAEPMQPGAGEERDGLRRSPTPIDRFSTYRLQKVTFLLMVLLPSLLAATYFAFIAADQYASEFRFGVRAATQPVLSENPLALLAQGLGGQRVDQEPYMAASYMRSRNLVHELDREGHLRAVFTRPEADWIARFDPTESEEDLWRYWQHRLSVTVDRISGLVTVRVVAFRPDDAVSVARDLAAAAERMIDRAAERARREALAAASADLDRASERHSAALQAIREVREQERILDPLKTIEALLTERTEVLRQKLALERERSLLVRRLASESPQMRPLNEQIRAIAGQLAQIDAKLTSEKAAHQTASQAIARFEEAELERLFSEKLLEIARGSYERARVEAERQHLYFATFVEPQQPQTADYPKRIRSTAAIALAAFVLWGLVMLVVAGIRDQRLTS